MLFSFSLSFFIFLLSSLSLLLFFYPSLPPSLQSEHMGFSLYDLVLEEDHNDVKEAIAKAEARAHARMGTKR